MTRERQLAHGLLCGQGQAYGWTQASPGINSFAPRNIARTVDASEVRHGNFYAMAI